ncbi:hypothetical protein [Dysgonomonas sp. Marseille-P4361]|uniref:hypothetical protein n=1 Tax=Dysgonomonas sp. Marseille-P4361 TaxID=2161820 RepID=UPI000D5507BF|nr:hypothetical protein [Dysgonomonas sp. Marseille-P4361]
MAYAVHLFLAVFLDLFYPDDSWLNELTDYDHMVKYDTINLAEIGADPEVLENNTVYPLVPVQREDNKITATLSTFDTKPTHITNVEDLNVDYKKTKSVMGQHVNALRSKCSKSGAFSLSPQKHTIETPVLKTTGAPNAQGYKALTYEDITNLSLAFDDANIPEDGRVIVLCPQHKKDLKNENMKLYKAMMSDKEIDGFKIYSHTANPTYDAATGEKKPYGAADGNPSSFAFYKPRTLRARGSVIAEAERHFATYRGNLVGAQVRFVAMPLTKNACGAIYSDNKE